MSTERLYFFDCQATTPVDPAVSSEMFDILNNCYGNPHSSSHQFGWRAIEVVEHNRVKIANAIKCDDDEIIFTSGATESNNLAIKGVAEFYKTKGKHIITMSTEHKCVLQTCRFLEQNGYRITYLEPEENGLLDLEKLKQAIQKDTILISIMTVNNETGVLQYIKGIGAIARENGILFHTDAAQAFGKIPLDVEACNIDLMSISSHKIYGPKGVGALYVRKMPRVRLSPMMHGGGQERGMRSGTLAPFLIAGFGKATEIMLQKCETDKERIMKLEKKFLDNILKIEDCFLNGHPTQRIYGCVNLSILHIEGESLIMALPNICISTGSACESATLEPSYVIKALRKDSYYAHTAIRFGFSRFTTEEEVDYLIDNLTKAIHKLRASSPLWEMKKSGIDFNSITWDEDHH